MNETLAKLVEQIEKCKPTDDHGHDFRMNQAFIEAKVAVALSKAATKFEEPAYRRKSWFDDDGQFGVGA